MKIFSSEQIKKCDEFTILNEPVTSVNLMERAAQSAVDWILKKFGYDHSSVSYTHLDVYKRQVEICAL